jgi:sporulation protein YlmC with PRC-barrel domain
MTIRASNLLGAAVFDRHGRRLGRVSDLLLDHPDPANICYALVDIENSLDEAGRTVAVPWSVLQPGDAARQLVLGVSLGALRQLRGLDGR